MARREYKGNAIPTRLTAPIGAADTSFSINNNSGWPTGGANGPFSVILEPDVAGKEEHVLVGAQSGGNCTSVTRGYGDTTGTTHGVGADGSVIHGTTKNDYDEANRHINDTTLDEHTQYMKADGTRHDLSARHTYGAALGARPTPVAVGTALAAGSGAQAAAGDHVHIIGAGAINATTLFAAGAFGAVGDISSIDCADTAAAGASIKPADAAHQHAFSVVAPVALIRTATNATGSSASHPRSDHQHSTANLGWGLMTPRQTLTTSSVNYSATTATDFVLNGMVVDAAREYAVYLDTTWVVDAGMVWDVFFRVDGTVYDRLKLINTAGAISDTMHSKILWEPTSGTKNLDVQVSLVSGSGNLAFAASSNAKRSFWVQDIGPR